MPKQGDSKPGFFGRIFRNNKNKDNTDNSERHRNEVTFANNDRYYNHHSFHEAFAADENNIRDENGSYRPTAAYHTGKSSKASRTARSCHGKITTNNHDSSDSDNNRRNNSFRSSFNPSEKHYSRRVSKRQKKVIQPVYEEYEDQSSSVASSHALQPLDLNVQQHGRRMAPSSYPDYYTHHNRQYEDPRTAILEQKLLESNQKIKECVNKYRREKARAHHLQEELNELTRRNAMIIYEQNQEIQKLKEENKNLRNSCMPQLFSATQSFQSQFQNMTPQTHLFSNFHNQTTPSINENFINMAPTRTVSEADNESAFQVKNFRDNDGVPEKMISSSSFPSSVQDNLELPRSSKEDSISINTLVEDMAVQSDHIPSIVTRDDGYSTSETGNNLTRNFHRRSRHFKTATVVPKKIRRTNSLN